MITCTECGKPFYCPTQYFRICYWCDIKVNPIRPKGISS